VALSIGEMPVSTAALLLSRLLSTKTAIPPAMKYRRHRGTAKSNIVKGSAVGVNAAVNSTIEKIHILHGRNIVSPRKKPMRLKVTKKIGSSKAKPKIKIIRMTKSK
jgi:hypothetical protein